MISLSPTALRSTGFQMLWAPPSVSRVFSHACQALRSGSGRRTLSRRPSSMPGHDDPGSHLTMSPSSIAEGASEHHPARPASSPRPKKKAPRSIRQHVNPLSSMYQQPVVLPDQWVQEAFPDPKQPFFIDIGCARGRFCVDMAASRPKVNLLGLEIRRPCVEEAFKKKEKVGVDNVHFLAVNANVDFDRVARDIKDVSKIVGVTIQFPDPQFKKKHKKRRMVQAPLVASIAQHLEPGCPVLIQSDVEEVAVDMREAFRDHGSFVDECEVGEWMPVNPLGVPTEREMLVTKEAGPIYRTMFKLKATQS